MFILYIVLFLGGFYLFGAAFNAEAWQALIFTAGILSGLARCRDPVPHAAPHLTTPLPR